jgi:hypothetical protein
VLPSLDPSKVQPDKAAELASGTLVPAVAVHVSVSSGELSQNSITKPLAPTVTAGVTVSSYVTEVAPGTELLIFILRAENTPACERPLKSINKPAVANTNAAVNNDKLCHCFFVRNIGFLLLILVIVYFDIAKVFYNKKTGCVNINTTSLSTLCLKIISVLKRACGNQRHCEGVNTSFGGRADVADKS